MKAPSEAPAATTSALASRQSARIAGTTSSATQSWKRLRSAQRYSTDPVREAKARPARLSQE